MVTTATLHRGKHRQRDRHPSIMADLRAGADGITGGPRALRQGRTARIFASADEAIVGRAAREGVRSDLSLSRSFAVASVRGGLQQAKARSGDRREATGSTTRDLLPWRMCEGQEREKARECSQVSHLTRGVARSRFLRRNCRGDGAARPGHVR